MAKCQYSVDVIDGHSPKRERTPLKGHNRIGGRMPSWRELFQKARVETNPKLLAHLLDETEGAMWRRLQNLDRAKPDEHTERCEIEVASVTLLKLRTEKLSWPHPLKS
jgi:hypothetical protein